MRMNRRATLIPGALALAFCASAAFVAASEFDDLKRMEPVPAGTQIPIFDFVRPILFDQVQLSHDGSCVGAIVPGNDDHTQLVTYEIATQKLDGVAPIAGDYDINQFTWLDGKKLIYLMGHQKLGGGAFFTSEAGNLAIALPIPNRVGALDQVVSYRMIDAATDDRSLGLFIISGAGVRYDHAELANVFNGETIVRYPELKTDHGFNLDFISDKTGRLAFGTTEEDGIRSLSMVSGESWTKSPLNLDTEVDVVGSGDNPGEVVIVGPRDGKSPRPLEFADAASGKVGDIILQDPGYDFDGWLFRDPKSFNIVGAVFNRSGPRVVWFTEAYRNLQKTIDKLFPNQVVRIIQMDDSGKVVLIKSGSDLQPPVYSWVNLDTHKSGLIKNSEPWIDPKRMRPMGIIKYMTAEGKAFDAYLTLPAGATRANPPPVVVIPSDSFSATNRWTWGFNPEVQFLASRGYAVLQPNFRASEGYSWMYPESEIWNDRGMADDVARATQKAIDMGLVDGKRVAVMGTSYGASIAAAAAANNPGLYKCAVVTSGNYDWARYLREDKFEQYTSSFYSLTRYKKGDPVTSKDKLDAGSALPNASKIRAAFLIVWGEYDDPEDISQAKDLASAVGRNGVPVETMSFLNEASGVRHLEHKVELYQHIEAFLSKNL